MTEIPAKPAPPHCFEDDEAAPPVDELVANTDDLSDRGGFDLEFLGIHTPTPVFKAEIDDDVVLVDGMSELRYEHFSLAMSWKRRMARWVAWNIDGTSLPKKDPPERLGFRTDHRLPGDRQITNYAYDEGNHLDRGHVSRRADLLWGTHEEAARANRDSFYFTNITPQMEDFNQSSKGGLWGCLENALYDQAKTGQRISVYGGPILEADDLAYEDIQVPDEFWKLLVYIADGAPRAKAFVLKQVVKDIDAEALDLPKQWETYAKTVEYVSDRTALDFGLIRDWDSTPQAFDAEEVERPITDLSAIDW